MEKRSNIIQPILIGAITLLIGTLLGLYFDSIKGRYKENIEYIDLKINSVDNYLKIPSLARDKLNILWEDSGVDNISTLTLSLYNFSRKDFENVEFIVELIPQEENELKIIASQFLGEDGRKDMIKKTGTENSNGKIKLFFTSVLVNRTDTSKPNIVITFLVAGEKAPEVTVFAKKKGVKTRAYSSSHSNFFTGFEIFLTCLIVFFLVMISFVKWFARKDKRLYNSILKTIEQKMISDSVLEQINSPIAGKFTLREIIHEIRMQHYLDTDWIERVFTPKPQIEDLHD